MTSVPIFWRVVNLCRRWCERDHAVSAAWLRRQEQKETRIEFHGVRMQWPVKKRINEAGKFNRHRLRRSA